MPGLRSGKETVAKPPAKCAVDGCPFDHLKGSIHCLTHSCGVHKCRCRLAFNAVKRRVETYCIGHMARLTVADQPCASEGVDCKYAPVPGMSYCKRHKCSVKGCPHPAGLFVAHLCCWHKCVNFMCTKPRAPHEDYCSDCDVKLPSRE